MDLVQAIVLALVQGISEFLPISSSAHLILFPQLFGWDDQGTVFDVAVHLGTLIAVIWAFKPELGRYRRALGAEFWSPQSKPVRDEVFRLAVATLPALIVGALLVTIGPGQSRDPLLIAIFSAVFALALGAAEWWARRQPLQRKLSELSFAAALGIGCAQALALFPGTSRSGVTLTAGIFLGMSRTEAARFSFLMAIPIIALAAGHSLFEWAQHEKSIEWAPLATATITAAVVALLCIRWFLRYVERIGLWPFVIYRLLLSIWLLYLFL